MCIKHVCQVHAKRRFVLQHSSHALGCRQLLHAGQRRGSALLVRAAKSVFCRWELCSCAKSGFSTHVARRLFSFSAQTISKKGWRRVQWLPFATGTGKLLPPTRGDFFYQQESIRDAKVTLPAVLTFFWKSRRLKSLLCAPGSKYTHIRRECCRIERSAVSSERKSKKVSRRSTAAN